MLKVWRMCRQMARRLVLKNTDLSITVVKIIAIKICNFVVKSIFWIISISEKTKAYKTVFCLVPWKGLNIQKRKGNPPSHHPKIKSRDHAWVYRVYAGGNRVEVCRKLILDVYKISIKSLRVIQQNVLLGETIEEKEEHNL